jgi:tetratricopeptide (TPR) repeat protein
MVIPVMFIFQTCCQGQSSKSIDTLANKHEVAQECIDLNNKALAAYLEWPEEGDDSHMQEAAKLIDEAVNCDTNFVKAIDNQFVIYFELQRYEDCFVPLTRLNRLFQGKEPMPYTYLSVCSQRLNRADDAHRYKKLAIQVAEDNYRETESYQNLSKLIGTLNDLNERHQALEILNSNEDKFSNMPEEMKFLRESIEDKD